MSQKPLKILVATDDSAHARKALKMAARLATLGPAEVEVVSVVDLPADLAASSPANTAWGQVVTDALEGVFRQALDSAHDFLHERGIEATILLKFGTPWKVLCEEAAQGGFDVVLVGSRGRSEVKGYLMGSVSDRVMHHASCSVMVVR